jgi:AmpE protein
MKLIALMLGLALERLATRLLHLRELRWFDGYFDYGLAHARRRGPAVGYALLAAWLIVPLVPVLWVSSLLQRTGVAWDLPYLIFAVLVVFFCLGPRDLASEVDDYCAARDSNDLDRAGRVLFELSEGGGVRVSEIEAVEEAVFIQANNRLFGVVFWFTVLGPGGAWMFRLSDLLRRRAAFEAARNEQAPPDAALTAMEDIHGVLAWVPARLAALGFALSGSFDDALNDWRAYRRADGQPIQRGNDEIAARVGKAAMTGFLRQPANSSAAARNAMRLVMRTLFIWITIIALMTIFGWAM